MRRSEALFPSHDEALQRALHAVLDPILREPVPQAFQDVLGRLSARDGMQSVAEAQRR